MGSLPRQRARLGKPEAHKTSQVLPHTVPVVPQMSVGLGAVCQRRSADWTLRRATGRPLVASSGSRRRTGQDGQTAPMDNKTMDTTGQLIKGNFRYVFIQRSIQYVGPLKTLQTSPGRPVHSDTYSASLGSIPAAKTNPSHFHHCL